MQQRTVMFVHAHPDDETTKAGGLAAALAADGVRTVLVTCTDGSSGEVTDVALLDGRSLAAVRSDELGRAADIMGFAAVHELGYLDSGIDSEVDDGFANLPLDAIVPRLVELIELEAPSVIVTYDPAYAASHPDHLQCHDISASAFAETTEKPSGPQKLYGSRFWSKKRLQAMHDWMAGRGGENPYAESLAKVGERPPDKFTTRIPIGDHALTARNALKEHRTQIAHDNSWFYSIPDDAYAGLYPWAELELLAPAFGTVPTPLESDIFSDVD